LENPSLVKRFIKKNKKKVYSEKTIFSNVRFARLCGNEKNHTA